MIAERLADARGDDDPCLDDDKRRNASLPESVGAQGGSAKRGRGYRLARAVRYAGGAPYGLAVLGTSGSDEGVFGGRRRHLDCAGG